MTKTTLIIFTLLCFSVSFSQNKNIYGVTSPNGDTIFWYKHLNKQRNKLSLPSLDSFLVKEYYRVWTNQQVINIWQNKNGTTIGELITWTNEYAPYDEKETKRTYVNVQPLTGDTAEYVRQLFLSSGILGLPTDDSIKGWQQGLDGIIYTFEQSTNDTYSFKTYWTPKAQDSLIEAMQVQSFIDSVFSMVDAQQKWQSFAKNIPYQCYINGGPSVTCKKLTAKEIKKYVKERKNYRQQMHLQ